MEKKQSFQQVVLSNLDCYTKNNENTTLHYIQKKKKHSKWFKDLSIRMESI